MPFEIVRNDITAMRTDAIVNAANTGLRMGSGVCGAIFRKAGAEKLQRACDALSPIRTGEAVITPGFNLPSRYIIHTAGPIYSGGSDGEEELLRACYRNSMTLAEETGCESVSFPLISSGVYGYPAKEALEVAIDEIRRYLEDSDLMVFLVVLTRSHFCLDENLVQRVEDVISERMTNCFRKPTNRLFSAENEYYLERGRAEEESLAADRGDSEDEEPLSGDRARFTEKIRELTDKAGGDEARLWRKANIDEDLYQKILEEEGTVPRRETTLALAVALRLSLDETKSLLALAGDALSCASKFDIIVSYFIENGDYDIYRINSVLFKLGQPTLGI